MLKIENVSKFFASNKAVQNLNMTVAPGQVMGLIGQNGSGKTTTFRMILKFIEMSEGKISWKNQEINQELKQRIGFLPEERGLYQKVKVEDQILYFAELHGMSRSDARIKLKEWFERLEVVGKVTDKVQSLSKGNAQKVQFIATLIHEPDILILDEPFTGLDPINTSLLRNEIQRAKKNGAAVIFSNHNMSDVEFLSDNLTMLKKGKTVLQGSIQEIRQSYGRTRIFLDSPISNEELSSISGVLAIEQTNLGRNIEIEREEVGKEIFKCVSQSGYVQGFTQSPPSLDEIFRREVEHQEKRSKGSKENE
ncbi:MAG: ABC transporter ATP-binding protein [Lactovum sp.]